MKVPKEHPVGSGRDAARDQFFKLTSYWLSGIVS